MGKEGAEDIAAEADLVLGQPDYAAIDRLSTGRAVELEIDPTEAEFVFVVEEDVWRGDVLNQGAGVALHDLGDEPVGPHLPLVTGRHRDQVFGDGMGEWCNIEAFSLAYSRVGTGGDVSDGISAAALAGQAEFLRETDALQLAGRAFRDFVEDKDLSRHLKIGQPRFGLIQ